MRLSQANVSPSNNLVQDKQIFTTLHTKETGHTVKCEIPLLRPPEIKTSYLFKTLLVKFKLFFFFISYTQCTFD